MKTPNEHKADNEAAGLLSYKESYDLASLLYRLHGDAFLDLLPPNIEPAAVDEAMLSLDSCDFGFDR